MCASMGCDAAIRRNDMQSLQRPPHIQGMRAEDNRNGDKQKAMSADSSECFTHTFL